MIAQQISPMPQATPMDIQFWLMLQAENDPAISLAEALYFFDPYCLEVAILEDENPIAVKLGAARMGAHDKYLELSDLYFQLSYEEFAAASQAILKECIPSEELRYSRIDEEDELYIFQFVPVDFYGISIDGDSFEMYEGAFDNPAIQDLFEAWEIGKLAHPTYGKRSHYDDFCTEYMFRSMACELLADSLFKHTEKTKNGVFDNVAVFIQWIHSLSDNTLFAYDEDSFGEMGFGGIEWDELDFAWAMQEEAEDLLDMAFAGIEALEKDPVLSNALISNYNTVFRALLADKQVSDKKLRYATIDAKEFINNGYINTLPEWPQQTCLAGDEGLTTTQIKFRNIRFWRDDAYSDEVLRR